MQITRYRQLYPGLALALALPGSANAEALDFGAKQYSLGDVIEPASIVARDFNGDGAPDAVTVNEESGDVSILPGNRDGSFQAPRQLDLGGFPGSVAVGDFNRDGALDLSAIVGDPEDDDNVVVLIGHGDGSFDSPQYFAARKDRHRGVNGIAVGDFNRDGALDMVTTLLGTDFPVVPYAVSVLTQRRSQ